MSHEPRESADMRGSFFFASQCNIGGIIMLTDSKADEPEDLIEPLPGEPARSHLTRDLTHARAPLVQAK